VNTTYLSKLNLFSTIATIVIVSLILSDIINSDILIIALAVVAMPHFAITLFIYKSTHIRNIIPKSYWQVYFLSIPLIVILFILLARISVEIIPFWLIATIVFFTRAFDAYHVQRQYFGVSLLLDMPSDPKDIAERNKFHILFAVLWFLNVIFLFKEGKNSSELFILSSILFLLYAYRRGIHLKDKSVNSKINIIVIGVAFLIPFYDVRLYVLAILSHYTEYLYLFGSRFLKLNELLTGRGILSVIFITLIGLLAFYSLITTGGIFSMNWEIKSIAKFIFIADSLFLLHYYLDSLIWKSRSKYYGNELRAFYKGH
jgi:hypothetical protein